ncbi:MAG: ATP-binding protein [Planctomycetota bacterium]
MESVLNLEENDIDLHIEYMDAKRIADEEHFDNLARLYAHKFADIRFDLVLTADDLALQFALARREALFGDAPIVFCGVNHYRPALLAGHPNATGVIEAFNVTATLRAAHRLHPDRSRLFVINDQTATGRANRERVREALADLPPFAEVTYLEDLTIGELQARLRELSDDALVLLMSFTRDRAGHTFRYRESIAAIRPHCPAPMYGVWSFYLGRGIVGGQLTDGHDQGRAAARMALRIFAGEAPASIPVEQKPHNRWRFDYRELVRFGLDEDDLPDGSLVTNRPSTFYSRNRRLIWTSTGVAALLLGIIAILLYALRIRKRVESMLAADRDALEIRVRERTRELEEANQRLQDEIQERRDLEEQLIRTERLAAVGTLAGGVAHEFNNINVTVLGFVELALGDSDLKAELREFLERIRKAAKRAKSITHNLLTFSQSRRAPPTSGNLVQVVHDTLDLVRREIESQGIAIREELAPTPLTTMDAGQIGQVVFNLLTNAQHAMLASEDKVLTLSTGADEDTVFLHVSDTGCGLSPSEVRQVFTPFWSRKGEHASTPPYTTVKGTGLGLSICHRILENHGGSIDVESQEGAGSTFTIRLPLAAVDEAVEEGAQPVWNDDGQVAVLVVDDEADTRDLLRLVFEREGHAVQTVSDGEKAIQLLWRNRFDVAFVDLQMPQMDGETLLRQLAELPPTRQPAPVVITGRSRTPSQETLDALGVVRVLRKPFEISEIAAAFSDALRARAEGRNR